MGRGKPSLASTVNPEEIIHSEEELGNIPNFLLKDEDGNETMGIVVDQFGYNVTVLKDAYKKEKDENGNATVVHYKKWEEVAYTGSFESAYCTYVKMIVQRKDARLKKARSIEDVVRNRVSIKKMLDQQIPSIIEKEITENTKLVSQKEKLKRQIEELQKEVNEMKSSVEEIKTAMRNAKKASKYTRMEEEE